ncbi:hypothetical protein Tco_1117147 [Tanacetum coccineum]
MRKPGQGFSGRVTPLFHNMLVPPVVVGEGSEQPPEPQPIPSTAPPEVLSPVTTAATSQPPKDPSTYRRTKTEETLDSMERAATTATSLEAEQASGNIHKTQFTTTLNEPLSLELDLGSGPWRQETIGGMQAQTRSEGVSNLSSDPPLSGGHTLRSGEDSMEHQIELTDNVPNTPHDSPLPGGYIPGSDEGRLKLEELMAMCTKLSKQVLDLEKEKDAQAVEILNLKKRVKKLERQRKSSISHPRRRIYRQVESSDDDLDEEDASKHGRTSDKTKPMFKDSDFDDLDDLVDEGMAFFQEKDANNQGVSTAGEGVSTAAPRTPPTTITVFDDEDVTMAMAQTLIKMKEEKAKEKGVAIKDVEDSSRPIRSITTLQPLPTIDPKDKGKGILQETKSVEKTKKKVQGDAQIKRDVEVALRLQAELDEELILQARIDANYELAARMTQEEQEKYTIEERASQLKGRSYEEIQGLYERQQKRIQDFTPMDSKKEAQKSSKRLKRVAGSYATQKSPKKPKVMKSTKDVTEEEEAEYEKEKEELRLSLKIISNDDSEVDYEPLSRKFLIVNWEYQLLGKIEDKDMYIYKLTRADGSLSYHGDTQAFLRRLDMQDLNDLYKLVQERFQDHPLEGHDFCGVHTLFLDGKPMEINMLVEKKYPLIKELLENMLNLQLKAEEESTMAFELIKFIKSLLEE